MFGFHLQNIYNYLTSENMHWVNYECILNVYLYTIKKYRCTVNEYLHLSVLGRCRCSVVAEYQLNSSTMCRYFFPHKACKYISTSVSTFYVEQVRSAVSVDLLMEMLIMLASDRCVCPFRGVSDKSRLSESHWATQLKNS